MVLFYREIYAATFISYERKEGFAELPSPILLWLQHQIFSLSPSINCAENKGKGGSREV